MAFLGKLWRGLYSVSKAFWLFYVLGLVGSSVLGGLVIFELSEFGLRPIGLILGLALFLSYMFIASVGVWRSAGTGMGSASWGARCGAIAARVVVGLYALVFLWRVVDGSLMAIITGEMG